MRGNVDVLLYIAGVGVVTDPAVSFRWADPPMIVNLEGVENDWNLRRRCLLVDAHVRSVYEMPDVSTGTEGAHDAHVTLDAKTLLTWMRHT